MNLYEELLNEATSIGVDVVEKKFRSNAKGLCKGCKIGISSSLSSDEKACILAEELGHYHTTVGDIIEQSDVLQVKQENLARAWAIKKILPLSKIEKAVKAGYSTTHEMAEHLNLDEGFIKRALIYYEHKVDL